MKTTKRSANTKDLQILGEMVEAFSVAINQSAFAGFVLLLIEQHFGFGKSVLRLTSSEYDGLLIAASRGLSNEFIGLRSLTEFGSQISGKVAVNGEAVSIPDLMSDERTSHFGEIYKKEDVRSLFSIGLSADESIIGVLTIYGKTSGRFTQKDIASLTPLADYAATFLRFIVQKDESTSKLEGLQRHTSQLEQLKSFHELIIENIPVAVVATNMAGYVILMNREMERVSRRSRDECLGKRWFETFDFYGELKKRLETSYRTSSPQYFPEIHLPRKDGSLQPVEMKTDVIKNHSGDRKGVVAIASDISEKKQIEREIEKIERLAAMGKLTAGIAHEIRNPLAGISGTLQVLKDKVSGDSETEEIMNRLFGEINRLDKVVERLYWLTSPKKMVFDLYSISDVVEQSLFFVQKLLQGKRIRLIKRLDKDLRPMMLDKDAVQQIMLNIILNGMNAMPEGGTLTIETVLVEDIDTLDSNIVWHSSFPKTNANTAHTKGVARYLAILLTDNGTGIPHAILPKIFEAFFSSFRGGTGLGLYMSAKIIEQHHGMIGVKSQVDKGSTFYILLPAKDR